MLSRKKMERIHIGDNVVVTVLEIRHNRVQLGIDAPPSVHVIRAELRGRFPGIEVWETDGGAPS